MIKVMDVSSFKIGAWDAEAPRPGYGEIKIVEALKIGQGLDVFPKLETYGLLRLRR